MITAEIRIMDDNGNIIGTYNQEPARISYSGLTTTYEFSFTFVTLDEGERNNSEIAKPKQSIPYADTHIVTEEDLQLAYNRGYQEGLKRALF